MKAYLKSKSFTVIAVLILFATGTILGGGLTSGKGKMSGVVIDKETGQPIEGVTVKLFMPEVNQFHHLFPKTNSEGKWKAVYIRKGTWNLDFEKSGYETVKLSFFVDTTPGTKNPPIEIQMPQMEGPTVSDTVFKEIESAKRLMVEQKYEDALKMLLKTQSENKDEPGIDIVCLHIGNCYAMKENYTQAIEFYKQSFAKFPKNKELIISIGNAYNNLKDDAKAMEWFQKLSIDEIGNRDTLYNIGVIAYNGGNPEVASSYFKKATEVSPNFADAFFQYGMTLTALEKSSEAVVALKKFMELAPDSPNYETAKAIIDTFNQ